MTKPLKIETFGIRLDTETLQSLERLAAERGRTRADVLRRLIQSAAGQEGVGTTMTKHVEELNSELDELSVRMKALLEQSGVDTSAAGRLDRRVREVLASDETTYTEALEKVSREDVDATWEYLAERQEETGGQAMARAAERSEITVFSNVADAGLRTGLCQWWRCRERGDQAAANSLYDVLRRSYGDAVDEAIRGGTR